MFCHVQTHQRSHESPMDFEWQTHAPMDPKSPFPQSKSGHKSFDSMQPLSSILKRSPPSPKFRNPSFTTPRKAFEPELFSETSGIESSPGEQADADDTPEKLKSSQSHEKFTGTSTIRQPIFGKYGAGFLGSSPSRTDHRRGKYSKTILQKIRKRKRIDRDYNLTRDSDSDSEGGDSKSRGRRVKNSEIYSQDSQPGFLVSFFNYIESHPNLPSVLSFYAQLSVNLFIAGLMIFAMYTFWTTVRSDVDKASEHERSLALAEISKCAQDYVINGCSSKNRAPVMEIPCNEFDLCMNRDPNSVGRARISAHTFAQIFNSFIEPISYKAMIFIVLLVTVTLLVNNLAFGLYRSRSHHQHTTFQSSSFPNPNPQTWISQIPPPHSGKNLYGDLTSNSGSNHSLNIVNQRSRKEDRSRSPEYIDRGRSKSCSRG